jgi:hypothetical protein
VSPGADRFAQFVEGHGTVQAMTVFLVMAVLTAPQAGCYEALDALRQDAKDLRMAAGRFARLAEQLGDHWQAQRQENERSASPARTIVVSGAGEASVELVAVEPAFERQPIRPVSGLVEPVKRRCCVWDAVWVDNPFTADDQRVGCQRFKVINREQSRGVGQRSTGIKPRPPLARIGAPSRGNERVGWVDLGLNVDADVFEERL